MLDTFLHAFDLFGTAVLAVTGALVFVTGIQVSAPHPASELAGFAVCFIVRALGITYGWSLPVYRVWARGSAENTEKRKK